jgi:hypothetical protein
LATSPLARPPALVVEICANLAAPAMGPPFFISATASPPPPRSGACPQLCCVAASDHAAFAAANARQLPGLSTVAQRMVTALVRAAFLRGAGQFDQLATQ